MKHPVESLLNEIGVSLNGKQPYDVIVHDERFLDRVLYNNSLGAGESYVEGWWDCQRLDELFFRICRSELGPKFYKPWKIALISLKNTLINQQSPKKSEEVANTHYNLGNDLYELMLGKSHAYTCGYWKDARSLDEAEFAKYELICKKLLLQPGETVLELGSGWGGLAKHMAENYGVNVVGIDIARGPSEYAREICKNLPVSIYNCDYREVETYNPNSILFDKLVSIGVLEHIGYKNYDQFLTIARNFIKPDGLFLLHSIGGNLSKNFCDPWINKYIFPNGMLPSIKQLGKAFENKFIVEDFHNFGAYYDKTLLSWHQNLNQHWPQLKNKYDEQLLRMMNYYLLTCAGSFRARDMQLWQFVLSPKGLLNGYTSIRP